MTKKLIRSEETYIQFTPEELAELGWEAGDKFSYRVENGAVTLTKYAKLELDMTDWPNELLLHLIKKSIEEDVSVNDVICNILTEQVEQFKPYLNGQQTPA